MTNPYDEVVDAWQQDSSRAPADPANPYDAVVGEIASERQQRTRAVFEKALSFNPDQAAEAQKLANTAGLPVDVVERNQDEVRRKQQARMLDLARMAQDSPILARQLVDPSFTKQAHDDVDNLTNIERTFTGTARDIGTTALKGAVGLPQAAVGLANIFTGGYAGKGVEALGIDFKRTQEILSGKEGETLLSYSPAQQAANQRVADVDGFTDMLAAMVQNPSTIATLVGESLPQMFGGAAIGRAALSLGARAVGAGMAGPALPGLLARQFGERTATLLASAFGEGAIAAGATAEQLRSENTDGLIGAKETLASLGTGAGTALFGFAGGRVARKLGIEDIDTALVSRGLNAEAAETLKKGFVSSIVRSGISEGLFEELPQSIQEQMWQNWANDKPLGQGVGKAAAQGVVAGFAMGGGFQAIGRVRDHYSEINTAQTSAQQLLNAVNAAAPSALRERNPEQFRATVQAMADNTEGAPSEIYIDAEVLNQLAPEVLAQLPQSVRDQIPDALAANDVVSISTGDALTIAPGTPLEQVLVENARVGDPRAMTQVEANQAAEKAQEFVLQQGQRVIQQAADQQAVQQSHDIVKQTLLDQLNTVGRDRPAVNQNTATLYASLYTTLAGELGITPEAAFGLYGVNIVGQTGQGGVLDQPAPFDLSLPAESNKIREFKVGDTRIVLDANANTGTVKIASVRTPASKRGQGGARAAMQALIQQADREGVTLMLDASALDKKTSTDKLIKFYESLGFAKTGNKVNALGEPEMARSPQQLSQAAIPDTIEVEGKTRPTTNSNGQPLAQTEEGVRNFWRWFGDSKVVDADGKPLVVYHGTPGSTFEVFDKSRVGTNVILPVGAPKGFYFAKDRKLATRYGGNVIEAYIAGEPLLNNSKIVVVGDATQIKSATGNNGEYNPNDPNILNQGADDYGMTHRPPGPDSGAPLHDLTGGGDFYPADVYSKNGPRYYGSGNGEIDTPAFRIANLAKGKPDQTVTIYRAVPSFVESAEINPGDWVSITREYAEPHGEGPLKGDYKIISKKVKASEIFTNADSIQEWGYWPEGTYAQNPQAPRGTFNPATFELALNENSNMSTVHHEMAHAYLEIITKIASEPGAPQGIVDQVNRFLKWQGITDLATWNAMTLDQKRPHHEAMAENYEHYLITGKAPSVELQPLFRKFKLYMLNAYRSLKAFLAANPDVDKKLPPEMVQFYDRMLASEEQIAQANEVAGLLPDPDADAEAVEKLTARSLRDLKWAVNARNKEIKRLQDQAKELRKEVEEQVTTEVTEMPEFQAKDALDKLRESTPEYKEALKLWTEQRAAALTAAAEQIKADLLAANPDVKGLKKAQLLAKNKRVMDNQAEAQALAWEQDNPKPQKPARIDADAQMESIAEQYQFTSVDEMLQAIDAIGKKSDVIAGMTDQRMLEEHGDLIDQRAIEQAANEAVHNEARARSLATELKSQGDMLNARTDTGQINAAGSKITVNALLEAAKQFAANVVGRTQIKDLQSKARQHTAAERRAGKRWQDHTANGETAEAVKAKQDQMLNNAAAKAALEAQAEMRKMLEYVKKFEKESVRKKLPVEYLDQIDQLLEAIDLRVSTTNKEIGRRKSLAQWVASQHALGLDPILPARLLENMALTSFKEMTVDEFTELTETIKNIEHLGRLKSKLLAAKDKREFDVIAEEIAQSIITNGGTVLPTRLEPDGRISQFFKGAWADHRKLNSLVHQMDGGVDNGPFYRAFVRSMNDAGSAENVMLEKATEALAKIYAPIEALPGGISGGKIFIPEIRNSLSRAGRLSIALNWGNEQNRQRVMDGDNWTEAQVDAILKTLTPVELQFVNDVWAHIDGYWPDIQAKQLRVSGVVEDKVEAVPFEAVAADGTVVQMRGGYYPIKYDGDRSIKADLNEARERASEIMRGAVARPTTRRGHTQARVDEVVGRPVKKDLSVITQHVNQVVHDLAWHEWFIDANRLLNDSRIQGAIRDHYGPEIARTMMDNVNAIAVGDANKQGQIDKLLLLMRANVTRSIMGVSMTTALLQPFGLTQSMARIGVVPVLKGAGRWAGDAMHMESTVGWITEKSEFMRLRSKTFNRELREISQRVQGKSKLTRVIDTSLFMLMQKMQMVADVPTWVGQYEKALAGGVDESTAVALADEAVLASQGGGTTKDMAAIQRNNPFLTQFYGYFSTTLQLVAEKTALTDFKNPRAVAGWLGDMALLTVIPAILPALITYLLKGGGEDDDPEKLAKRLAGWQASYLLGMFVGLRELPTLWSPFDYGGPPAGKVLNDAKRLVQQAGQGEVDDPAVIAAIGFMGTVLGLPTTQLLRSYKGWLAWDEGDAPATSVLFGPPPRQ